MKRAATKKRASNARGSGVRLREEIVAAATAILDVAGEDEALSLRAVAREVGVAATSVYLHFADRDALLEEVMHTSFEQLMSSSAAAEDAADTPMGKLRARLLAFAAWARTHRGLYKFLHESSLHTRRDLSFLRRGGAEITEAVRRVLAAQATPSPRAAETIAFDVRTAVHGMLAMRLNQPYFEHPPFEEQLDRFLAVLVGAG